MAAVDPTKIAAGAAAATAATAATVRLSLDAVRSTTVDWMLPYAAWHAHHKYIPLENEHYRLLANIAAQFRGAKLATLGPGLGFSALALAHAAGELGNVVTAYDETDRLPPADSGMRTARDHPAVRLRVLPSGLTAAASVAEVARDTQVIVLDLERHDGEGERAVVAALAALGWKGLLVMDDIHLSPAMERAWADVAALVPRSRRVDATEVAHWSGTGLVAFEPSVLDLELAPREPYAARDRATGKLL